MNKIIRFFPNSDLRKMHDGLALVAKEHKIDVSKLKNGEFVFFSNSSGNRLKIYCANNVIAYIKHPMNHRLDLNVIQWLPSTFDGKSFNLNRAMEKSFTRRLRAS